MSLLTNTQPGLQYQHLLQRSYSAAVHFEEWCALRIRQRNQIAQTGLLQMRSVDWGLLAREIEALGAQQQGDLIALRRQQRAERAAASLLPTGYMGGADSGETL